MSLVIPLQAIAGQRLRVLLGGNTWDLTFKAIDQQNMAFSCTRNNTVLVSSIRVVAEAPLIPYRYLEDGNFIFISENQDIPFYTQFGVTQTLLYFTGDELRTIRGGN